MANELGIKDYIQRLRFLKDYIYVLQNTDFCKKECIIKLLKEYRKYNRKSGFNFKDYQTGYEQVKSFIKHIKSNSKFPNTF